MEFISGNKQHKQFLQANNKLCEGMELPTKNTRSSLNTEIIRQTHKIMMDGEDILMGEYRKSPVFAGYHVFEPAGHIERYMQDEIFRFHETKKDDPIMSATSLFGNIINIHPF